MRRWTLALLLTLAGTAHAALPRVVLEAPLAPVAPAILPMSTAAGLVPLAMLPAPSAPLAAAPAPAAPAPLPLAAPAAARPAPAAALPAPAAAKPKVPGRKARKLVDALRASVPALSRLPSLSPEAAASVLDGRFDAAASLDPELNGGASAAAPAPAAPGDGAPDDAALLDRLLERVTIDDGGAPERGAEIRRALALMLKAPTARALAARYVEEGAPAVVRFTSFPGSQVLEENGVKRFYGKRAETPWRDDRAEVLLNEDYLKVDPDARDRDLPPVLAHELFGHALWYSRAARENAYLAFHHHELNEANARLVGWLVDFELDGFLEEQGTWSFLQDPARYLSGLKLRLPYYAATFSSAEMGSPIESLEARREAVLAKRARLETERANHRTWNAVIDHFVARHGLEEARVRALRRYMVDTDANYGAEIAVMDDIVKTIDGLLAAMRAEPDRQSENYLKWAATHPIFDALRRENDANTRRLLEQVRESGARPDDEPDEVRRAREEYWRGQVTFEELVRMYEKDRAERPEHWKS